MNRKIRTAIIPMAGMGTRFLPLSKIIPKEFFPLRSKPVIQYIMEEAADAGVERIIFVISPEKKKIFKDYILKYFHEEKKLISILKKRGKKDAVRSLNEIPQMNCECVIQQNPLGDGDAVLQAEKLAGKEPFLVLFGDDVCFGESMAKQLVNAFNGHPLLCLYKMPKSKLRSYGVPKLKKQGKLYKIERMVEKPENNPPSPFAMVGKFVFTPEIFRYLKNTRAVNGEILLVNAINEAISDNKEVYGLAVKGRWLECGSKEKWTESFLFLANKRTW